MRSTLLLFLLLLPAGCARMDVVPAGASTAGTRFYLPEPYLLVSSTGTSIVYLPNPTKAFAIQQISGMGTINTSVVLKDGWQLQSIGAQADSKIPETLATLTAPLAGLIPHSASSPMIPELYHIECDPQTGIVYTLKRVN